MDIMFSEETLAESSVYGKNGRNILNPVVMSCHLNTPILTVNYNPQGTWWAFERYKQTKFNLQHRIFFLPHDHLISKFRPARHTHKQHTIILPAVRVFIAYGDMFTG